MNAKTGRLAGLGLLLVAWAAVAPVGAVAAQEPNGGGPATQAGSLARSSSTTSPPAPSGIAVDGDGNVVATDYTGNRVLKYGPDGTVVLQWGGYGTGMGQFSGPFGVAVDDRNAVYVVDQLNARVQKFAADGTFVATWGSPGAGSGQLRTPFGVASAAGRILVADFGNDRVQLFTPDGQPLHQLGDPGGGDGQFLRPAGVAVDRDGSVYVSDHFNNRVQKFSSDGHFQAQVGTLASPTVAGSPTPSATPTLLPTPSPTGSPAVGAGTPSPAPLPDQQLDRPEGLAVDRDGALVVADYGRNRVVRFGSDGRLLGWIGGRGSGPGEFVGPKGVAVDPQSGRLYVADTGNGRIQRFLADGTFDTAWPLPDLHAP